MSTVTFDYDEFIGRFPHIGDAVNEGKITADYVNEMFNSVGQWLGVDDAHSLYPYNPDKGIYTRQNLLYLATCHLITLGLWPVGQNGRIASASQGSVSTSFDLLKTNSLVGSWWLQTPCGSQYWIMSSSYRKGGRLYISKDFHPYG
jgi:hypothetical protein